MTRSGAGDQGVLLGLRRAMRELGRQWRGRTMTRLARGGAGSNQAAGVVPGSVSAVQAEDAHE